MSSNIHIFTHNDLDGVGCLQILIWYFSGSNITYDIVSSPHKFNEIYTNSNKKKNIDTYDKVFITDLSLLDQDIPLIDKKNVIYVDHHKTNITRVFKHAANFSKIFSSCTLLLYKLFKNSLHLTNNQKKLITLIDDYDNYKLVFADSKNLNTLFWAHYYNNVPLFLSEFNDGFHCFNNLQIKILEFEKQKIDKYFKALQPFFAKIKIQNTNCSIAAAFADFAINDISDFLFKTYNVDIVIIINLIAEKTYFRRSKTSIDVSLLAEKLCEGGGHEAASGGKITKTFLDFTKLFTQNPVC